MDRFFDPINIRGGVNFPALPTTYGDDLSYLETVSRLCRMVNDLIEQCNLNTEDKQILENEWEIFQEKILEDIKDLTSASEVGKKLYEDLLKFVNKYRGLLDLKNDYNSLRGELTRSTSQLNKRMDTFVATQKTTDNAETTDIRNAWNGKTYSSAGESVRNQAKELFNKIDEINTFQIQQKVGKNKFDNTDVIRGYFLHYNSGALNANENYCCSNNFIQIKGNTSYYVFSYNKNVHICLYDKNREYISGVNLTKNDTFVTPNNCVYIKASIPIEILNTFQIEEGTAFTYYNDFHSKYYLADDINIKELNEMRIKMNEICKLFSITNGKNLYNKNSIVRGYFRHFETDKLMENANYCVSDECIPVKTNTYYYLYSGNTDVHICYYDSEMDFIGGEHLVQNSILKTPHNCYYVRISCKIALIGIIQLEEGNNYTGYSDYNKEVTLNNVTINSAKQEVINVSTSRELYDALTTKDNCIINLESGEYDLYTGLYENVILSDNTDRHWITGKFTINGNNSTIKLIIPSSVANAHSSSVNSTSIMDLRGGTIEINNVNFVAQNSRYCCHYEALEEESAYYADVTFNYCAFDYKKLSDVTVSLNAICVGIGGSKGQKYRFKRCKFKDNVKNGIYIHTRDFNIANLTIDSCIFDTTGDNILLSQYTGNGKPVEVTVINSIADIGVQSQISSVTTSQWKVTKINSRGRYRLIGGITELYPLEEYNTI